MKQNLLEDKSCSLLYLKCLVYSWFPQNVELFHGKILEFDSNIQSRPLQCGTFHIEKAIGIKRNSMVSLGM